MHRNAYHFLGDYFLGCIKNRAHVRPLCETGSSIDRGPSMKPQPSGLIGVFATASSRRLRRTRFSGNRWARDILKSSHRRADKLLPLADWNDIIESGLYAKTYRGYGLPIIR